MMGQMSRHAIFGGEFIMGYHALADVLGIEEPMTNIELIDVVRHGLPSEGIAALSSKLAISSVELSKHLHVSPKTLQRQKGKILDINISDRLLTIAIVYVKCLDIFGTEENSVAWLKSPIPALGNVKPLAYLDTNAGAEMIMTLLGRIEYGVYS
jgi:putative toxin-antitoxin system antitoxin component (TIGR02293 family)